MSIPFIPTNLPQNLKSSAKPFISYGTVHRISAAQQYTRDTVLKGPQSVNPIHVFAERDVRLTLPTANRLYKALGGEKRVSPGDRFVVPVTNHATGAFTVTIAPGQNVTCGSTNISVGSGLTGTNRYGPSYDMVYTALTVPSSTGGVAIFTFQ